MLQVKSQIRRIRNVSQWKLYRERGQISMKHILKIDISKPFVVSI